MVAGNAADGAGRPWPEFETLVLETVADGVAVLRLNRPDRMNAQTVTMFGEYGAAARVLRDSGLRALVLTGSGERAFCAGFDLGEIDVLNRMGTLEFLAFQEVATGGVQALRQLPFPVVAAVHGAATGGGLALALAADVRLVAPTARFGAAFVGVGLSFGELGVSYHLSRLLGPARAAEIGYTARLVGAEEAVAIGLANRLVPSDALRHEAVALATTIAARPELEVRLAKQAVHRALEVPSYAAALALDARDAVLRATAPPLVP